MQLVFPVWRSLLSHLKFARGTQIKQEQRPLLQRKWVLFFISTQVEVLIRICFLHLLLCPNHTSSIVKAFHEYVSMHDHHSCLFYYSVQGSGAEQPSGATSVGMQNFHVSSGGVSIWLLWQLGPDNYQLSAAKCTKIRKPLFKYWQKRNKHLVPNVFQMPLHLSGNAPHRKFGTFLSPSVL